MWCCVQVLFLHISAETCVTRWLVLSSFGNGSTGIKYCGSKVYSTACDTHIALQHTSELSNSSYDTFYKQRLVVLQVQDFATVVFRMKALGFNTIKLPFSFEALNAGSKRTFPDGCSSLASSDTLKKGLTEGGKGGAPICFCCFQLPFHHLATDTCYTVATVVLCQLNQQCQPGLLA